MTRWEKMWMDRRSAIEPVISHLKHDHNMIRNFLKGKEGDRINAVLAAAGCNLRKLIRAFFLFLDRFTFFRAHICQISFFHN
ncbi:transposase DDE domain protein [Leptospira weilii str. 2006001855]|nr:transposase DDE domain protein [Leptospira weilii str. 2006001855]